MTQPVNPTYNPYAPPASNSAGLLADPEEVDIRRRMLNHETVLRIYSVLYLLSGVVGAIATIWIFGIALVETEGSLRVLGFALLAALASGLALWAGIGMWRLSPQARPAATFLAILGLFRFPVGTVMNGILLLLLYSDRGKQVLSEEYQAIVRATPQVKLRQSMVVQVVIPLLALGGLLLGLRLL